MRVMRRGRNKRGEKALRALFPVARSFGLPGCSPLFFIMSFVCPPGFARGVLLVVSFGKENKDGKALRGFSGLPCAGVCKAAFAAQPQASTAGPSPGSRLLNRACFACTEGRGCPFLPLRILTFPAACSLSGVCEHGQVRSASRRTEDYTGYGCNA